MNKITRFLAVATAGLALSSTVFANHHLASEMPLSSTVAVKSLESAAAKLSDLIGAFPADKLSWAPDENIRDVRGVVAHIAGANYFIGGLIGKPGPEGFNADAAVAGADAAKLKEIYQASVAHAKAAIQGLSAAAAAEEITYFGMTNQRAVLVQLLADHNHEHLGQLIAYARSNKVVPPWSQ